MTLLFLLCHWHGLAKLCMHTDDILRLMESITVKLGNHLHTFTNETCSAFSTKELRCEAKARTRCQGRETLQKLGNASSWQNDAQAPTRKAKTLNLQTYKLHALGDYPEQMQTYSTTDSYSMQPVSYLCLLIYLSLIFPPRENESTVLAKIDLLAPAKRCSFLNLLQLNGGKHAPIASDPSWLVSKQGPRRASQKTWKTTTTLAALKIFQKTSCCSSGRTQMIL